MPKINNILFVFSLVAMLGGALYLQSSSHINNNRLALGVGSFFPNTEVSALNKLKGEGPVSVDASWGKYMNTAYNYTLRYPTDTTITSALITSAVENSAAIVVTGPEPTDYLTVTAWVPQPNGDERGRIAALLHKSFAQTMRMKEVNTPDPNHSNKKVGELEEFFFAGYRAYAITVTGTADGHGNDTIKYVYLDSGSYKLVLAYPLNDGVIETISKTFKFTK